MNQKAFQDMWPEELSYCFGCGRNNEHGFQIKSYWEGEEAVCTWKPEKYYMAGKGVLCGGVIATLIDCHCLNTAGAAVHKAEGREIGTKPFIPYATGTLQVRFIRPIPLHRPVVLRARVKEMKDKKIIVTCSVFSGKNECASGEIIAIQVPEPFWIK